MMQTTMSDGQVRSTATIRGNGVYLDVDAIVELAKGSAERRRRFFAAIKEHGTLLFSLTHAAEIGAFKGRTADVVGSFLSEVGPHWAPLEMNVAQILERERQGLGVGPVSEWFIERYVLQRMQDLSHAGPILDLSSDSFFDLGAVVFWMQQDREGMREQETRLAQAVRDGVKLLRSGVDDGSKTLDSMLPPIPFHPQRRAEFVMNHLIRTLVKEARSHTLVDNDGMDYCHAIVAVAYARVASLDRHWKRRVGTLPESSKLARVFYRPEMDALVDHLESLGANGRAA